jgi:uncharacterized repeat protein (TIGR03803 family)
MWMKALIFALVCAAAAFTSSAQTFTTLANFDGANGQNPYYVTLVQGLDGGLYGTTVFGGVNENGISGTVFKVTPDGTLTTVYSFCSQTNCTDGSLPYAGLVLGTDGNFYGTTRDGGTSVNCDGLGCGTVFKVTPEGVLTTLHSFNLIEDGSSPYAPLIQGTDGDFYGTTSGDYNGTNGYGTIFRITPGGSLKTLHRFSVIGDDGTNGGLVQASDGDFYGTTVEGGTDGFGTVYRLSPSGTYTTLYSFCSIFECADGRYPESGLIQGPDGNLYGTTSYGGTSTNCVGGAGCGTVFKLTLQGILTTLLSFDESDGAFIQGPLILATDGNFYGISPAGGEQGQGCAFNSDTGCGTIYQVTPAGILTTLNYFNPTEGANNLGGLLQATNGILYGTTLGGGTSEAGTVFSLSLGLGQFVETLPTSGKVGAHIKILGSFLTGATSVTFNGTAATFTIISKSEILTTVPTGATTGTVQVISPRLGTLSSNVPFRVN